MFRADWCTFGCVLSKLGLQALCPAIGAAVGAYCSAKCLAINADLAAAELQGGGTAAVAARYNEQFATMIDGWLG